MVSSTATIRRRLGRVTALANRGRLSSRGQALAALLRSHLFARLNRARAAELRARRPEAQEPPPLPDHQQALTDRYGRQWEWHGSRRLAWWESRIAGHAVRYRVDLTTQLWPVEVWHPVHGWAPIHQATHEADAHEAVHALAQAVDHARAR
ncbi:hypothetical protein [Sediminicurvatus halobius]|uniref:Uncharacterized protein n=1 Tax=Sediminicurvatus halobius TaxID=2182432 RepID=A0A2U2MXN3_9GAMM|nr:hypothetical protein [Spiribacter halobius]PWG61741.1 hypothetical protein DEM34_14845 [Spiribacter halobius]UEX76829.1 hypothetical protein LMH63_12775 [Spiribacter halobius]